MKIELFDASNLNFVEFNITGDGQNYIKCDSESKFLDSEVFNLFSSCFEKSDSLFDYFTPSKYNPRNIIKLKNALLDNLEKLIKIDSNETFIDHISQIFLGNNFILKLKDMDKAWESNWKVYLDKLKDVNKGLIELIDKCIEEDRILWVIGY
ncbi:MAG: hypothetical protein JXB49_14845 [Bacteroidales bacterium]|nr:hypothetical protein [Bacteroidales bacterium]